MDRGAHRASLAAALVALLGALGACGKRPELAPVTVVQVRAGDFAPALAEAGLDAAATAGLVKDALRGAGLRIEEDARRGYVATLEVVAMSVGASQPGAAAVAEVVVELRLMQTWAEGPSLRRSAKGRVPLAGSQRLGAWREALRQGAVEAASAIALDLRALQRPTERLIADLSSADPRARERAVRALASRGGRGASRAIAALVRDRDPAVASAAVDAVVSFRDPASAVTLIDAAQAGDSAMILRLLPVLVEVGGPDVEGYLLTLRAGHGDRAVRRAAEEALTHFRARAPARGATP